MGSVFFSLTDTSDLQLVSNVGSIFPIVILCHPGSSLVNEELYV